MGPHSWYGCYAEVLLEIKPKFPVTILTELLSFIGCDQHFHNSLCVVQPASQALHFSNTDVIPKLQFGCQACCTWEFKICYSQAIKSKLV